MNDTQALDALAALCGSAAAATTNSNKNSTSWPRENDKLTNPGSKTGNQVLLPEVPASVVVNQQQQPHSAPGFDTSAPSASTSWYAMSLYAQQLQQAQQAALARSNQQQTAAAAVHHHDMLSPSV